jgi:hypothetical protein
VERFEAFPVQTRRQKKVSEEHLDPEDVEQDILDGIPREEPPEEGEGPILPFQSSDPWTFPSGVDAPSKDTEERWEEHSHLLLTVDPELIAQFVQGYKTDSYFRKLYVDEIHSTDKLLTPSRFQKGSNGLLYFQDADWNARLCVPSSLVPYVLKLVHDSAVESAHAGPRRFLARMKETFYWPRITSDVEEFTDTCDVCQKIKVDHRRRMGGLRPAHVPARPFATVSLDLITGLPPSGPEKFTAVLVIVDKLTKYSIIVATHNQLSQEGFARIFVDRVVNVYGLPERIICDRDKHWSTAFWRSVVSYYGSSLALSSAHHPQTDGQTDETP